MDDKSYSRDLQALSFRNVNLDENNQASKLAEDFPGLVDAKAERIQNEIVKINLEYEDLDYLNMYSAPETWRSTGLYAPAGEVIEIIVPEGVTDLDVQIGAHTDDNSRLPKWDRAPIISLKKKLVEGINKVNSPYGGLIYFIPTVSKANAIVNIRVTGAVRAPYFILGVHSNEEWLNTIKNFQAPWAELQSDHVILTISSKEIRELDNPTELMLKWDEICEEYNTFVGLNPNNPIPHKSPDRQARFVSDKQIVAGWLHAGYPIMLFEGVTSRDMISIEGIQDVNSGWGFWHELGHNYQQRAWVWDEIIEVTCNIFSLYIQDKYNNKSRLFTENAYEKAFDYIKKNCDSKNYNDYDQVGFFERLVMFRQLQLYCGWEFYTKLHIIYRELAEGDIPSSEQEKIDLFVINSCKVCKEDLLEFYTRWGLKFSESVKVKIDEMNLPKPKVNIWELIEG